MPTRQRIISYGIPLAAVGTIAAAAFLHPWSDRGEPSTGGGFVPVPSIPTIPTAQADHQIDVVFAVDTTSSMSGLLEGAKRTVWSIASHIRRTDPNAELRIGLVAYRDLDDVYVTKPFALTGDLDAVFSELSSYEARGGGDLPENVDAAMHDAVTRMAWRPAARKLLFVVGDAPPATRGEVPSFADSAREAAARGIKVNTIRCGGNSEAAVAFERIAALGNGEFSSISQDGGVQQVATPYDDKLAELSRRIDRTAVIVGSEDDRTGYAAKIAVAEAAAAPAKADRATYYAKSAKMKPGRGRADKDAVSAVAAGTLSVDSLDDGMLPAELRGKTKAEIKAELGRRAAERAAAQKEIEELSKQRDEYISARNKGGEGGFDAKVKATVERQLK